MQRLEAFERAQKLSPSSALALFMGGIVLALAGNAERAMEWAERRLRVSPTDRLSNIPHHVLALGHFLQGQYDEAAHSARRAVQAKPEYSVSHALLAAALAKLGQVEAAEAAAMQVMARQPSFSSHEYCASVGIVPALAKPLAEAWRQAGLPPRSIAISLTLPRF